MHFSKTTIASLSVFIAASIWGVYWVPLRYLDSNGISGAWAVVFTNIPAALVLGLFVMARWNDHKKHLKHALLIGFFAGIGLAFYTMGLVYSSVVRATLLFYLTPIWGTIIGMLWLNERVLWLRWLAIGFGLFGVTFLVSGESNIALNIGDIYAFFSGLFWAIAAAMIMRHGSVTVSLMAMTQFFFAAIGAIFLGWLAGGLTALQIPQTLNIYSVAAGVSLLALLPAVCIIFWAQKFLFPGRSGLLMMSEVVVAILSASLFIPHERMNTLEWVGAALIIAACFIEVFSDTIKKGPK